MSTKKEKEKLLADLIRAGTLMSNICWNLWQHGERFCERDREIMGECWRAWDAARLAISGCKPSATVPK